MLQQDLQKLEQIQSRLSDRPGKQSLQIQLLGQQMLLCEHLKETQQALSGRVVPNLASSEPFCTESKTSESADATFPTTGISRTAATDTARSTETVRSRTATTAA